MYKIALFILLMLVPFLCGCVSQNNGPSDKILVATTLAPLGDFVRAVGGERVDVMVLVPPGAEPHTFEPTPSQMARMSRADVYVMNGAGIEFWMDKLLQVNSKMVLVDSSQGIALITESGGETDPHVWVSLRNAAVQVNNICDALVQVDPSGKDYYLRNRDDYLQKLRLLDANESATFALKSHKIFIVHHPAWTYFARDYGLQEVPLMENEKEPGPKYLGQVIDLARKNNINTIFVEPEYNPKSAEVIAREMNASIVNLDPLAGNYLENMRYAGEKIAESLGP